MTNSLDGAAACSLGYIDYGILVGNSPQMIEDMRKKRLAFAKLCFMMACLTLLLVDKPSKNSVLPMILGQIYSSMKLGTHVAYNMTPEKFFVARTFLGFYNIAFLLGIWYKLRTGRDEKLELEYNFFVRVDQVMARMAKVIEDDKFEFSKAKVAIKSN
mmetsp:Transcript_570/g.1098  ORF Transcript_570/g.1098 Transcript_570/m.1098 type:complete len:158 (-) Transcript_570:25-498(-)